MVSNTWRSVSNSSRSHHDAAGIQRDLGWAGLITYIPEELSNDFKRTHLVYSSSPSLNTATLGPRFQRWYFGEKKKPSNIQTMAHSLKQTNWVLSFIELEIMMGASYKNSNAAFLVIKIMFKLCLCILWHLVLREDIYVIFMPSFLLTSSFPQTPSQIHDLFLFDYYCFIYTSNQWVHSVLSSCISIYGWSSGVG